MATNKKVNLLEILAEQAERDAKVKAERDAIREAIRLERVAKQAERQAIREAKAIKSDTVYEPYIYPRDEQPVIVIDKVHVLKRLETLTDVEPLYFHEYPIKDDERVMHYRAKVNRSDPNREAMDTLNTIVTNHLARKQFKPYKRSAIWVRAPKGKRVLRVEIKRRGS
jgi:hypothetical protein